MRVWLQHLWARVRGSFWFLPAIMILVAVGVSLVLPEVDRSYDPELEQFRTTAAAARAILSSLAGALITVAGVVFSLTMVALSITSSQYGPRLMRYAMEDRVTQFSLGAFLASSIYCLMVLRRVQEAKDYEFVPNLSVFAGVLLSMLTLVTVVYFIHHLATSTQAHQLIASVGRDLLEAVDRLYPREARDGSGSGVADDVSRDVLSAFGSDDATRDTFRSTRDGYVQAINTGRLVEIAKRREGTIEVLIRPGEFIHEGTPLATVQADELPEGDERESLKREINEQFLLGSRRTPEQDVGAVIDELVEVGVRALSPGINDPQSACMSLDRLKAGLARLLTRERPTPIILDEEGRPRVRVALAPLEGLLRRSYEQFLTYGKSDPVVLRRIEEHVSGLRSCVDEGTELDRTLLRIRDIARGHLAEHPEIRADA